jgi:hypothetical protein
MTKRSKLLAVLGVAAATVASTAIAAGPASASTGAGTSASAASTSHVITQTVTGYFRPDKTTDGQSPAVTTGQPCGTSFIDYNANGNKKATVTSGWNLYSLYSGYYFYWKITVTDKAGSGNRYYYGNPDQQGGTPQRWQIPTGWVTTHSVTGPSTATLSTAYIDVYYDGTAGECVFAPVSVQINLS